MVFKAQQEENPLYGLIGMGMVGGGADFCLPPHDFGAAQTWLGSDRLKMAV